MTTPQENDLELALIQHLVQLGYTYVPGPVMAPEGSAQERETFADVLLWGRIESAIRSLNPTAPSPAINEALRILRNIEGADVLEKNQHMHAYLTQGVEVTAMVNGEEKGILIQLLDIENPHNNDLLVTNQFCIIENNANKRPDVLLYINGFPLVVIELKKPDDEHADILKAYNQLQTYKRTIPSLFTSNAFVVASDGYDAVMGSISASFDRFLAWKATKDGLAKTTVPQLTTLTNGLLNPATVLDMMRFFMVFEKVKVENKQTKLISIQTIKKVAAYHQYYAVNKAIERAKEASGSTGDRKAGVVWHTQGSGKSLSMTFYAGKIVHTLNNPTIVVITDRNDLDDQLFDTFSSASDSLRQTPVQANDRSHLKELLKVNSGGIVFTTIHKFFPQDRSESFEELSDRRNIIVMADEAHRTQYGFKAKTAVNEAEGTSSTTYGFAKYLRDALPNASFIGFTGTPVEKDDANTPAVFGDYIDVYDIKRAVDDGSTVPIYYESRLAKVRLDETAIAQIDAEVDELLINAEVTAAEEAKAKWAQLEAIVGEQDRIQMVAADFIQHFEERTARLEGKAMFVCMSRKVAAQLYREIETLRPNWHNDDLEKGAIKLIMTSSSSDTEQMQRHNTSKQDRKRLAERMKDAHDPLKVVIVVDMWLTGFDAPCLHTLYVDKPMRGHNLMQAIARVNRVYKEKQGGLIVDYIGIATELKKALKTYTENGGEGEAVFQIDVALRTMQEKLEVVRNFFHHFSIQRYFTAEVQQKLQIILEAQEHILSIDKGSERFVKAVDLLSKAHALCAAEQKAREVAAEVGLYEAIRKRFKTLSTTTKEGSPIDIETAIKQIVDDAIVADGVIDIFDAAGIKKPDLSILSPEFMSEVRTMKHRHLAIELLKKLLADDIKIRSKQNQTLSKKMSERLQAAIAKYQNNLLTSAEIIEELISMANDLRSEDAMLQELGISAEEKAFYDALAASKEAIHVLGDAILGELAHELVDQIKKNATVDWTVRESARAKMRVIVKRLLNKYGYPPDLEKLAVDRILRQSEQLAADWASS